MLGRPATKSDVDVSLAIPPAARARIVGGYDAKQSRLVGTWQIEAALAEARLPPASG